MFVHTDQAGRLLQRRRRRTAATIAATRGGPRRTGALVVLTLLLTAVLTPLVTVPASVPAQAAVAACGATDVYVLGQQGGQNRILKPDGTAGATTALGDVPNFFGNHGPDALGLSSDGTKAYWASRAPLNFSGTYFYFREMDLATGVVSNARSFSAPSVAPSPYGVRAGAVNPVTGIYYVAYGTSTTWRFYAYDPNTGTSIGDLGSLTAKPGEGDLTFDPQGNLYLLSGTNGTATVQRIAAADVPADRLRGHLAVHGQDRRRQERPVQRRLPAAPHGWRRHHGAVRGRWPHRGRCARPGDALASRQGLSTTRRPLTR